MRATQLKQNIITDTVRKWILEGKYSSGDKLPTDADLADFFQVNKCTVSAGLNQLVKENMLDRAPRRGSVVKRVHNGTTSNAVTLFIHNSGEHFFEMAKEINRNLLNNGLYPVLMDENLFSHNEECIQFLQQMTRLSHPYGYLIFGHHPFPYDELKKLPYRDSKIVFIHQFRGEEERKRWKYVLLDFDDLAHQAVAYFAERNIERILMPALEERHFQGIRTSSQTGLMEKVKFYANKEGIEFDGRLYWQMMSGAPADAVIPQAVRDLKKPAGLFAWCDFLLTESIFPVLKDLGYDPVKDFAVLGNYNTHHAKEWGFDSFDHRLSEIAKLGVDMLVGNSSEQKILVKADLIKYAK